MDTQGVLQLSRVRQMRELKCEISRLKADNDRLRDENAALNSHLDMAIAAAVDLAGVAAGGKFVIVDGWNMILGAGRSALDRKDLLRQMRKHAAENPLDFVWIVYDGPRRSNVTEGRIRVSYTGGKGLHRADKLVCDFLRMARLRADLSKIEVRTKDAGFLKEVARITGR